jgi:hypothetical protein
VVWIVSPPGIGQRLLEETIAGLLEKGAFEETMMAFLSAEVASHG